MKLLFVTQDFPPAIGGIQTYAASLSEVFAQRCESFSVLAPAQSGDGAFDGDCGYRVRRVDTSSNWMRLKVLPSLISELKAHRPDAIFTGHWYVAAAALVAKKMGLVGKVYTAAHAMELRKSLLPGPLSPLYGMHRKGVIRGVDGVFPVSRFTGGLLEEEGVPSERIHVVPNGTELTRFDTKSALQGAGAIRERFQIGERPLLLTVGRMVERKGVDTVIESMAAVLQRVPEVRYLVVGKGPADEALRARVKELELGESVLFAGSLPYADLPSVYHACDIFVMPARQIGASVEGFGLVFCEANACGKPVVGGNSGGVPDAILNEETGLLVEPNSPSACAEAILRLLGEPALARKLGTQGLERIRREGTWDHAGQSILRVMEAECGLS